MVGTFEVRKIVTQGVGGVKKKYFVIILAIMLGGGAAAVSAWYWLHPRDPMGMARAAMSRGDLRSAQLVLRAAVRDSPGNGEAHFRLGTVQLQLGDAVAAEKELRLAQVAGWNGRAVAPLLARATLTQSHYEDVLKEFPVQDPASAEAAPLLVIRALAQIGLKDPDAAEDSVASARRMAPDLVDVPLADARIALARNDPSGAEQKLDRALEIDSRSVEALALKGALQHARGDDAAALRSFDAALAVAPDAASLRLERANTLIVLGRDQKARQDVDAILKANLRDPLGNYLLTVLSVRARDWQGADVALQRISPVISRFPRGEYFLALVKINLDQVEQAIDASSKYVAQTPQDVVGYKLLARIDARAQRPQQMVEVLSGAVDAGLADVELLELLGGAYVRTGQTMLAIQTLDKAAALAGADADALTRIASIRLGIGDVGGAERDLLRSFDLAPDRIETSEGLVIAALAAGDVAQSAAALEKLRAQPGIDPVRIGNLEGVVRLAELDLTAAQTAFETALRADPSAVATRVNLARVLVLQGRAADAEKLLGTILDRDPANIPALSAMSRILLPENRAERMVALLEAARRAAPGSVGMTVALADLLANTGEARKAYDLLEHLPKDQGAAAGVPALRARLQSALGMDREAQDTYRQILATSPRDLDSRRCLADLLLRTNNTDEARRVLNQGLEVSPGNLGLLEACVAIDFRAGGLDAALLTAGALARETANLPAARLLKGELYMSVGRYADAAAAYQAELNASPSGTLAVATAVALDAAGHQADAVRGLTDWIARQPADVDALKALASLDIQHHRLADAETNLRAVLAIRPNDPIALNNLAWAYHRRSDKRARAMAQKAYLLAPGPQSADTLGWILSTEDEPAKGLLLLRQAAAQQRSDPTVQYHLAVTLKALGQTDPAVEILTRLVASPAEFDDKPAARSLLRDLGGTTN